ncbi:MFS transporter [Enterobacter roggenkampii]|uniref:MFS transporter n=1 Tax=Enterobacter roggenkampii TaxID=1812935 RepID=UPI0025508D17|nr:MFS transporter [Enterobacter roggenkampii]MDK4549236.1 MFS transporter [Enterobacter roggenkampii]
MGEISVKTGNNARNGGKNSLNRLIRCVCGKKIGPDPRNFNQRVSLGRNDLLIRTFPKSFVLFRHRGFAVLMACALLTSISLGFYNTYASPFIGSLGVQNVAAVLALGQLSEIIFILSVPFVIKRIGMKWALLVGMSMWGIRFIMFILAAQGHTWTAVVGVGLHGICNDFFLIISAMYIDRLAPAEMKVQAQSWLIIAISGFGAAFGSLISGTVYSGTVDIEIVQSWIPLWSIPIGIAVVTSVIWLIGFKEKK